MLSNLSEYDLGYVGTFFFEGRNRTAIVLKCENCDGKFLGRVNDERKYCSRRCSSESKRTKVTILCDLCGNSFEESPSDIAMSKFHFCSRECKDLAQRIDSGEKFNSLRPEHYGLGDSVYTYRRIAFEDNLGECESCNYSEHSEILEAHHIDGDRKNSLKENLIVLCPNCHVALTRNYADLVNRKIVWKNTGA